ncbi:HD-GYP domain-containing protein [Polynucleobacter necessarius]|uniref:HD-GYP domain-containing protein n=1 Tax=Polynucleobacter necessarius TaxID=576610 RepID=UPI000E09A633|nr:HD domain-containing phosphohydrolase [Polynucleobacter necessarius]
MKYSPIKRLNFVLIASICVGEALIMFVLPSFGRLSTIAVVILDVALLILIIIPLVRWIVIRPMKNYIHEIESAHHTIAAQKEQLLTTLNALAKAKDNDTGDHILRTQKYVEILAKCLQHMGCYPDVLTDHYIKTLVKVAPLHDLGKVGIPDHILNKQGRFTDEERTLMNSHPMIGESILTASQPDEINGALISMAIKVAGSHHERWDGKGYPRKISGQDIPIEARIMSVADVFDALVSDRPYKKGWPIEDVLSGSCQQKRLSFRSYGYRCIYR